MTAKDVSLWMQAKMENDGCLYQDDVVDYLVKHKAKDLLRENSDGNQVLTRVVLAEFRELNETSVVWVMPDKYWRFRVPEDEPARNARG